MFSVSLLYSALDFLKLIPRAGLTTDDFKKHFQTFKYATADKILDVCFKCGWIRLTQAGQLELNARGVEISELDYKSALLLQLEDLILNYNPVWGSVLTKGRVEVKNFLPSDASQCFKEGGLFDELNDSIIRFWDRLSLAYRNYSQKKMTEIGRRGEKLSYDHEWQRTGRKPIWQAVESNLSGFDILSVSNIDDHSRLQIEVKATTSEINYSRIHITQNEWSAATNSHNFIFHLWHLSQLPKLYEVTVERVNEHIPRNSGNGEWESVEIPFLSLIR
jgi:hypothetical protein